MIEIFQRLRNMRSGAFRKHNVAKGFSKKRLVFKIKHSEVAPMKQGVYGARPGLREGEFEGNS